MVPRTTALINDIMPFEDMNEPPLEPYRVCEHLCFTGRTVWSWDSTPWVLQPACDPRFYIKNESIVDMFRYNGYLEPITAEGLLSNYSRHAEEQSLNEIEKAFKLFIKSLSFKTINNTDISLRIPSEFGEFSIELHVKKLNY